MSLRSDLKVRRQGAVPVLVVYVWLLMALPSRLIFAPLGAAGTPADILAIGCMLWWVTSLMAAPWGLGFTSPVKWLLGIFAATLLVSYIIGSSRAVSTAIEVNSADRAVLSLCGWCGLALVVIDGVGSRRGLDRVLGTAVAGAGLIAVLGMLQFFFNLDIANVIHIPGLTANRQFGEVISRSAFRRVMGTTTHPIEFGVVLSTLLPLCVHYARFAERRWARVASWGVVLGVAGAIPLSVARSGILGSVIALLLMYPTWPVRFRRRVGVGLVAGVMAFSVVVPGLLGTIRGLFVNASSDPSTDGRTADYGPVLEYLQQRPLFGRGLGTFLPELYRTLDNQYLAIAVTVSAGGPRGADAVRGDIRHVCLQHVCGTHVPSHRRGRVTRGPHDVSQRSHSAIVHATSRFHRKCRHSGGGSWAHGPPRAGAPELPSCRNGALGAPNAGRVSRVEFGGQGVGWSTNSLRHHGKPHHQGRSQERRCA